MVKLSQLFKRHNSGLYVADFAYSYIFARSVFCVLLDREKAVGF